MFQWDARHTDHSARHRVTRHEAAEAMADRQRRPGVAYDRADETRYAITGRTRRGRLLTIFCTYVGERRDQRIRVITARPANTDERGDYEGNL